MPSRLEVVGENVVVSYGARALAVYERDDQGMRNLAIVSLTQAGVKCVEVGRVFGMRPEHVSRLRGQLAERGSGALVRPMGRPRKLDGGARVRAYEMSDRGVAGCEIAKVLGVSEATVSRVLARRPTREVERLPVSEPVEVTVTDVAVSAEVTVADVTVAAVSEPVEVVGARIGEGPGRSVYAGAMLLHPFLEKVGAGAVLSVLDSGPSRSYDTTAVAVAAMFAFALGSSSLEGSKHLQLGAASQTR
jgi:transposase